MTTKYGFRTPHHKPGRNDPGFSVSARRIESDTHVPPVHQQRTRLNGSRFGSVEAAKAFALQNLPLWYQWFGIGPVLRIDTKYGVEEFFSHNVSVDGLVMRRIGVTNNWPLRHPGAAALGLDSERVKQISGVVRWI